MASALIEGLIVDEVAGGAKERGILAQDDGPVADSVSIDSPGLAAKRRFPGPMNVRVIVVPDAIERRSVCEHVLSVNHCGFLGGAEKRKIGDDDTDVCSLRCGPGRKNYCVASIREFLCVSTNPLRVGELHLRQPSPLGKEIDKVGCVDIASEPEAVEVCSVSFATQGIQDLASGDHVPSCVRFMTKEVFLAS